MKRRYLAIVLALVLIVLSACTKESPDKPAGGGNDSKFAVTQAESRAAESSSAESNGEETSTEETSVPMEESSKPQESSTQESSENSSKPEESSETSSEQPEESSEESSEEESSEEESSEESSEIEKPSGDYTQSQLDAWNEAEDIYTSEGIGNSYDGLVQKVMDAGFDYEDAVWAVDQLTAAFPIDWYEEALQYAEYSAENGRTDRGGIRMALRMAQFTEDQVDYAMENNNIDWYQEAFDKADSLYHSTNGNSYARLIDDLLEREYSYDEAVWGVDHLVEEYQIDWGKQAAWFATYSATFGPVTRDGIRSNLEMCEFTEEEIDYAMANNEIDWMAEALEQAQELLASYAQSKSTLMKVLDSYGYTEEEIDYAVANCGVEFTFEALERARQIDEWNDVSERYLCSLLEEEGFSHDEASYAAAYCGADWVSEATNIASNYIAEVPSATYDELYQYLTVNWLFYEDQANAACAVYGLTP